MDRTLVSQTPGFPQPRVSAPTRALIGVGDGASQPIHVGAGLLAFGPVEV